MEINCLGQPDERQTYRAALVAYFEANITRLDPDALRRLYTNPLRILDTKNPQMQALVEQAPKLLDYLGDASLTYFKDVQALLTANGIAYRINPRLVRGLDYYNLTVFEFVTDRLGAQGTICGGGRYDYLVQELGGNPTPAVGWALGMERVLELLAQNTNAPAPVLDVFAVVPAAESLPVVTPVLQRLRKEGLSVQMYASSSADRATLKSQMKKANACGAAFAFIFGADELAKNEVAIKNLEDGTQRTWPLADIGNWVQGYA